MNIGASAYDLVSVYITPTEDIYQQFVGKNFPDWSEGIASPSKNLVVLKSPDIMSEHADIGKIAIHELVHILLNKAVHGNPIPRWFNEGLAVYYSGEKAFASGSLISKALITKSIIDLTEIDDVLVFYQGKAQLAYQESYLAVLYLFEQFGKDKVKEIISPDIRAKIIELGEILMIFDGETFIYEQAGKVIDSNRLLFILKMMIDIGEKIES